MNRSFCPSLVIPCAALLLSLSASAAPLTKAELLKLGQQKVSPDVMKALVQRDCVDFDIDATTLVELSGKVPDDVLRIAMDCRTAKPAAKETETTAPAGQSTVDTESTGRKRHDPSGVWFLRVPAGTFTMGCDNRVTTCPGIEQPTHAVTISRDFWAAEAEATNAEWRKCLDAGACRTRDIDMPQHAPARKLNYLDPDSSPEHPVAAIKWDDAVAFCRWLGGRLPTEAEWEYVARLGEQDPLVSTLEAKPHPVRSTKPNAVGFYGITDNVAEWIADWYAGKYYATSPATDPPGPEKSSYWPKTRVRRGGSFQAPNARLSQRSWWMPGGESVDMGVRCVRDSM